MVEKRTSYVFCGLKVNMTNSTTNKNYEFKVHRKDAITNIDIKPKLCIKPDTSKKVFLHQPHTMCSEKYIKEETQFLIEIFIKNGHKRTFLENPARYCHAKKKNNDSRNYTNSKENPLVPNIGPKIKKELKKVNKGITFISSKNLQGILCQKKQKLPPNSQSGLYQLDCSCNGRYIGKSKKKILTR